MRYATPEGVALAWAATVPGISPAMVGDTLPTDNATWAVSGYVTPLIVGGYSNVYFRLGSPVVTLQTWAVDPDTGLPPWGKARAIAETLRVAGTYLNQPVFVQPSYSDENARVLSSSVLSQPRRTYSDMGNYAVFTIDVQLHWVPVPK